MILRQTYRNALGISLLTAALVGWMVAPAWSEKPGANSTGETRNGLVTPSTVEPESLPADARELLGPFEKQEAEAQRELEARLAPLRAELIVKLAALQERYTKAGQLDEALAVRSKLRELQRAGQKPVPAPQNLEDYRDRVGKTIVFELVGAADGGEVWGSDVYTDDSSLAAAAVHAGVLRDGERGVVKVTILPGREKYDAMTRNGVTSEEWDGWEGSFRFER